MWLRPLPTDAQFLMTQIHNHLICKSAIHLVWFRHYFLVIVEIYDRTFRSHALLPKQPIHWRIFSRCIFLTFRGEGPWETKVGWVFPMIISSEFRTGQYRHVDHQVGASQIISFSLPPFLKYVLLSQAHCNKYLAFKSKKSFEKDIYILSGFITVRFDSFMIWAHKWHNVKMS